MKATTDGVCRMRVGLDGTTWYDSDGAITMQIHAGENKMKHKHADLIHAWADGAEIQVKDWRGDWMADSSPSWEAEEKYRIKPEENKPVVRWLWAVRDGTSTCHLYTEQELRKAGMNDDGLAIKLEWSRTEFPE